MARLAIILSALAIASIAPASRAQTFLFPTANRALLQEDGGKDFFTGTIGDNWPAGAYGCVRNSGWRMHEGIDIQCIERDKKGEPVDAVVATANGAVAYINAKPYLSDYGNYVVIRHEIESLAIYSVYAHLRAIEGDLKVGQSVRAGQRIATLGRTANHAISKKRAHLHFELALILNDQFDSWRRKSRPGTKNHHGKFNGQNLAGFNPAEALKEDHLSGGRFSLLSHLRAKKELYAVVVRDTNFPWLKRYPRLVKRNPTAEREGVAGYEISVDFSGLPYLMIPRAESEVEDKARIHLLRVDAAEYKEGHCRQQVEKRGKNWALTQTGVNLIELLVH